MRESPVFSRAVPRIEDAQRVEPAEILFIPDLGELFRDYAAQSDDGDSLGAECCQRAQRILDCERSLAVADDARDAQNGPEDGVHIIRRGAAVAKQRRAGLGWNAPRRTERP